MDSLTIAGIVIALAAVSGGQYLEGGELGALLNGPAFLIVLGGTLGAVMLQTSYPIFKQALSMLFWMIRAPRFYECDMIEHLLKWSQTARKKGLLALEPFFENETDPFVIKGLQMLLSGKEQMALRQIMAVDIETEDDRAMQAVAVYESMGIYSPTIGIIGAVLGLIQVMRNLTDPSELGAGIAVAFVATIYGVGLANLFFLPMANKLKTHIERKRRYREMIVEGLVAIADGEHPELIRAKLNGFGNTKQSYEIRHEKA